MKKSKFAILLTTAALIFGQLAACGGTGDVVETGDTRTDESTESTTAVEYVKPDIDLGGETFTIASHDFGMSYAVCKYTMISHEEQNGDTLNDAVIDMTRKVEDELNVKLELYPLLDEDRHGADKLSRFILAGEDVVQAAFPLSSGLAQLLATPSMLVDLGTIETLDLSHSWWDQHSIESYNIGGKQYTAIGDICFFMKCAPIVNFFNKQLIEDNGLENPYQLVYDGKWTFDKMNEMAEAAANDLNGNGEVDIEDCFGFTGESTGVASFMVGAGINFSSRTGDEVEITLFSDRAATMIEKIVPLWRNKNVTLLDQDFYGKYGSPFEELFIPTFMANRSLFFSNQLLLALDFRGMDADFGILPLPKYDESQPEYYSTTNIYWRDNLIVPVTNPDLERTGYILDCMGYYSQQLVTPAFIDSTVLNKSVRDEDSASMIELIYDTQVYDIALLFNWGDMNGMLANLATKNNTNLASEYAKIEPNIIAAMEKTMEELLGE